MSKVYKNPPIIEALCEFQFVPDQPWDWTIPGLFYREVESEFPVRRQFNPFEVGVRAEVQGAVVQNIATNVERMQFLQKDEGAMVQVGPNMVAVNHLEPYSNWAAFKQMIARSLEVYRQVANPQAINRVGLRYINRIEIPDLREVEIEDYLLAVPAVPSSVPQTFGVWAQRIEIPYIAANAILVLQSRSVREVGQENIAFLLDLDFVALDPGLVELDSVMDWVESAHGEIERTFEACVTDKARRLFGEVRDGE